MDHEEAFAQDGQRQQTLLLSSRFLLGRGSGGKSHYNKQRAQLGTYQTFCSDITSQDIESYDGKPHSFQSAVPDAQRQKAYIW
jgi:hypothetical protein